MHTICAVVSGVQTWALPIYTGQGINKTEDLELPVAHYLTSSYMQDQDFVFVIALASMHARLNPGAVRKLIALARKGVTQSGGDQAALLDRQSTRLNSSHYCATRMPSSA